MAKPYAIPLIALARLAALFPAFIWLRVVKCLLVVPFVLDNVCFVHYARKGWPCTTTIKAILRNPWCPDDVVLAYKFYLLNPDHEAFGGDFGTKPLRAVAAGAMWYAWRHMDGRPEETAKLYSRDEGQYTP